MVLMESYMFCASVRLAVLVISAFALVKSIFLLYIFASDQAEFSLSVLSMYETNLGNRASFYMVRDTITWLQQYPDAAIIFFQAYTVCHAISCFVAAYGAYKLKKNRVFPLAIFEFVYIVQIVVISFLFLRIFRHFISLEKLILYTLVATAYSGLVVYDFFALVAFEQILRLVNSKRYQEVYGPDPFNPQLKLNLAKHPSISYATPIIDAYTPKWWRIEKEDSSTEVESQEYFQKQELLAGVLLRNAINMGYDKRRRF